MGCHLDRSDPTTAGHHREHLVADVQDGHPATVGDPGPGHTDRIAGRQVPLQVNGAVHPLDPTGQLRPWQAPRGPGPSGTR